MAALEFGPPDRAFDLVFLHATGFNAQTYRRILAPLGDRFRILALDQRGHGATTLATDAEGRTGWDDFRDDLLALLDTLDVRDVALAGHSLGGAVSLGAAARAQGRVRRLTLLDPVIMSREILAQVRVGALPPSGLTDGARRRRAEFPNRGAAFHAYRTRTAFEGWPDNMLADYVDAGFRDLPNGHVRLACEPAWEASIYVAQANDPWSDFARSRCPIEILRAERQSTCRTEGEEEWLTAGGRIAIETVEGTSHFLPMERPELVSERLRRALES
jgi:pimeloyl-ACP methyl ester carboxylesterase